MKSSTEKVIPALVTPLNKNQTADLKGFDKIIQYLNNKGCNKFVLFGTSGEFSLVNESVKDSILSYLDSKNEKNKYLIACNSENIDHLIKKLKEYDKYEFVDGYLITPPYYFKLKQNEIISYYTKLINKAKKPILYYNIPQMTGTFLNVNTLIKLTNIGLSGIKDSSGAIDYLNKLTKLKKTNSNFKIYIGGSRILLQALNMGIDGVIGLASNINPKIEVDLINNFHKRNYKKAFILQLQCNEQNEFLNNYPFFQQSIVKGILSKLNIIKKHACFPMKDLDKRNIDLIYEDYKLLLGKISKSC